MTRRFVLVALLLALPCGAQNAPATYRDLLARAQAGDSTVDYTALRMAYAASPEYSPYGTDADAMRDSLAAALARTDFPDAVKWADRAIAIDFLDVRTHVMRAYASGHIGDDAGAREHGRIAARLVESITASGEGTERSPYVVVTVAEEYAFLRMNGYQPRGQGMGQCGTRLCDVMRAVQGDSKEVKTFYFDITLPYGHLSKELRPH